MKKYFYSAIVAMTALFTVSCSQDETLVETSTPAAPASVSFKLDVPTDGMTTRAADANVARYAVVIQNVDDATSPWTVKLAADGTGWKVDYEAGDEQMKVQANSEITIDGLTDGSKYVAYFWADYNEDAYDLTWATDITVKWNTAANKYVAGMAYCGSKAFTAGEDTGAGFSVTLTRAVAQVNFVQSVAGVSLGETLVAACTMPIHYNLLTGQLTAATTDWDTTGQMQASGAASAGDVAADQVITSFYVLAPTAGTTVDFYMTMDNWATNLVDGGVTNVPVRANYKTNIKGAYYGSGYTLGRAVFTVTTDDTWAGTNPDSTF